MKILDFHNALVAAGIPIDGVSGTGPTCRIDFRPEATKAQRDQAAQILAAFDWTPQKERDADQVQEDLEAWLKTATTGQLQKAVVLAMLGAGPEKITQLTGVPTKEMDK